MSGYDRTDPTLLINILADEEPTCGEPGCEISGDNDLSFGYCAEHLSAHWDDEPTRLRNDDEESES